MYVRMYIFTYVCVYVCILCTIARMYDFYVCMNTWVETAAEGIERVRTPTRYLKVWFQSVPYFTQYVNYIYMCGFVCRYNIYVCMCVCMYRTSAELLRNT